MKVSAIFQDGSCRLELVPENQWDKRLLGAVAGQTGVLVAQPETRHEGHFSYQTAEVVRVTIQSSAVYVEY